MNYKSVLKTVGAALLFILAFGTGWAARNHGAQQDIESLIKDREIKTQEIAVARVENTTLVQALAESEEDREVLLDQLASMRSKPAEIKYITRVETVLVGTETMVTHDLPSEYLFKLDNDLTVARFSWEPGEADADPQYYFDTADITIRANVVVGDRDSSLSLRMSSNLDNEEKEVPVDEFQVTKTTRERKLFEPNILLGGGVTASAARS